MNRKSKRYAVGGETDEAGKKEAFKGSPDPDFESSRDVKRGESDAADKPKRSSVTKEELEKSGLSLRDYLNKERGLSRRGGEAPKAKAEDKAEDKAESKSDKYADLPLNKIGRAIAGTFKGRGESDKPKAEAKPEPKSDKYSDLPLNRIGRAISGTFSKGNKAGGAIKMAKGGSASSRGDGIAQRGKTKGRII